MNIFPDVDGTDLEEEWSDSGIEKRSFFVDAIWIPLQMEMLFIKDKQQNE